MFFEYNIPAFAPKHIVPGKRAEFTSLALRLIERMEKLEEALNLTGMRGEVFSEAIAPLMANRSADDVPQLDNMTAGEIADAAMILAKGIDEASIPIRMDWNNCKTVVDTAFVTTSEWEVLRHIGIGGSDSACVMNDGYRTARDIYYDKTGEVDEAEEDPGKAYIFEYGHRNEDLVINQFCRRTGAQRIKETRMFCHKDFPFLTANIDAIIRMKDENGDWQLYVFEAKTTTMFNKNAWYGGAIPRQYVPQCHKYPIVLNDDRIKGTYIGCCYGNTPADFASSFVPRNAAVEFDQMQGEIDFWNDYVLAGVEPDLSTKGEKDLVTLNNKFGRTRTNTPVELDEENVKSLLKTYTDCEKAKEDAEKALKTAKAGMASAQALIIDKMDGAGEATCPAPDGIGTDPNGDYEFVIYDRFEHGRITIDSEKLKLQFPAVYDQVKKVGSEVEKFGVYLRRAR